MQLGFDVQIVTLPKGTDPADDPAAFEQRLHAPVSYPVHRVRLLHRARVDKSAASAAIKAFLNSLPDSPEHLDARRLAADLLDLPPETQAAFAPIRGRSSAASVISPRLLDAGDRLERSALAGVAAHPKLNRYLEELGPEHFDSELHRRARAHLLGQETADAELTSLLAEIYALQRDRRDHRGDGGADAASSARAAAAAAALRRASPITSSSSSSASRRSATAIREFA